MCQTNPCRVFCTVALRAPQDADSLPSVALCSPVRLGGRYFAGMPLICRCRFPILSRCDGWFERRAIADKESTHGLSCSPGNISPVRNYRPGRMTFSLIVQETRRRCDRGVCWRGEAELLCGCGKVADNGRISTRSRMERRMHTASVTIDQAQVQRRRDSLSPVYRRKFSHEVVDMVIDRPFANAQDNGNIPGAFSLLQPVEDFFFPV